MTSPTYQPKGSMCRSCVHQFRDCRHLDFSGMVPMVGVGDTIIVKCTDHQPIVPKPTPPASQESAIAPGMYQDTEGKVPARIGDPVGLYVQDHPFARQDSAGEADFPTGTPRNLNELLHTLTAELAEAREQRDSLRDDVKRLREVLRNSRQCLQDANEAENNPIRETIWFSEWETLFDYMDAALTASGRGVNDAPAK